MCHHSDANFGSDDDPGTEDQARAVISIIREVGFQLPHVTFGKSLNGWHGWSINKVTIQNKHKKIGKFDTLYFKANNTKSYLDRESLVV